MPSLLSTIHTSSQWQRDAAAVAQEEEMMEDEEMEVEDMEMGGFEQKNDPSSHNTGASQNILATKFQDLADRKLVAPTVIKTITEDMKLETMTLVQSLTINETLKGIDVYIDCPL